MQNRFSNCLRLYVFVVWHVYRCPFAVFVRSFAVGLFWVIWMMQYACGSAPGRWNRT